MIFNWKLKARIAQLEASLAEKNRLFEIQQQGWKESEARELALAVKIREMDQLNFTMSQCVSWTDMRPVFAKLKTFTDARMIDESYRIKTVLIPEMQKAYR